MSRALIAGAVLTAGLVSGGMLMQSGVWSQADAATGTPRLLDQVMARIGRDFIDTLTVDELYRKAATGFVRELDDPHSGLLTPESAGSVRESTSGRYAGVGLEIDLRDGFVSVIAPLAGTPADSAGVEPGDRIIAIDGKPTHGLAVDDVQHALRGPRGSTVTLTMERGSETPVFTLRRREIVFHPVQRSELLGGGAGVGYVRLAAFSEAAAADVRRAVEALRTRGATSLILDLRANPGGLLEQGIAVAELFLDAGKPIASTRGRGSEANRTFAAEAAQRWPNLAIVALVDSGTASAAEIVAGALQDNGRAVLVGSPTYGKGSAQSLYTMTEGYALKLTTARWFTPKGRTIERDSTTGGIEPDIVVRQPETGLVASGGREARPPAARPPVDADPVIARAMQLLGGVTSPAQLRGRAQGTPAAPPARR